MKVVQRKGSFCRVLSNADFLSPNILIIQVCICNFRCGIQNGRQRERERVRERKIHPHTHTQREREERKEGYGVWEWGGGEERNREWGVGRGMNYGDWEF